MFIEGPTPPSLSDSPSFSTKNSVSQETSVLGKLGGLVSLYECYLLCKNEGGDKKTHLSLLFFIKRNTENTKK